MHRFLCGSGIAFWRLMSRTISRPSSQHLFWHTVYLGLAYLNNPYVPAWRDTAAREYAQKVDPHVVIYGPEYESILENRVKQIFHQDPLFIFYTVTAKLGVLASMLLLCVNFGLWAAIRRPKGVGVELAFWLSMGFAALPGVIAIPVPQYRLWHGCSRFVLLVFQYRSRPVAAKILKPRQSRCLLRRIELCSAGSAPARNVRSYIRCISSGLLCFLCSWRCCV